MSVLMSSSCQNPFEILTFTFTCPSSACQEARVQKNFSYIFGGFIVHESNALNTFVVYTNLKQCKQNSFVILALICLA